MTKKSYREGFSKRLPTMLPTAIPKMLPKVFPLRLVSKATRHRTAGGLSYTFSHPPLLGYLAVIICYKNVSESITENITNSVTEIDA